MGPLKIMVMTTDKERRRHISEFLRDCLDGRLVIPVGTRVEPKEYSFRTTERDEMIRLSEQEPHIIITDLKRTESRRTETIGKALERMKFYLPKTRIIPLVETDSEAEEFTEMGFDESSFFEYLYLNEKEDGKTRKAVRDLIKKNIFMPYNIGVIGKGYFGEGVLSRLREEKFARSVNFWSSQGEEAYEQIVDRVIEAREGPTRRKFRFHKNIEDLLKSSDVIIYARTAISRQQLEEIIKEGGGRAEHYRYEREYIDNLTQSLIDTNYKGLVMMVTNPIDMILERMKKLGGGKIDPYQLTGSIDIDIERIRDLHNYHLIEDWIRNMAIGIHGDIDIAETKTGPFSPKKIRWDMKAWKDHAIKTANEAGRKAMKSSLREERPYVRAQEELVKQLRHLATIPREPIDRSMYAYVKDLKELTGSTEFHEVPDTYLAVPSKIIYRDGNLRVHPNRKILKGLVPIYIDRLKELSIRQHSQLKIQNG